MGFHCEAVVVMDSGLPQKISVLDVNPLKMQKKNFHDYLASSAMETGIGWVQKLTETEYPPGQL